MGAMCDFGHDHAANVGMSHTFMLEFLFGVAKPQVLFLGTSLIVKAK